MNHEPTKVCARCGEKHPLVFFRYRRAHKLAAASLHPICLGCEQDAVDETKQKDRWPAKAGSTIRRHAEKYEMPRDAFIEKYGWDVPRIAHILKHASENTCCYCREPYSSMGHGPADVTMDIIDPRKEPYLETNAQPCCNTCNNRKGDRTPEEWAIILRCWRKHEKRKRLLQTNPLMALPLWQAAAE